MKHGWGLLIVVVVGLIVGCANAWAATGKAVIKGTTEGSRVSGSATLKDTPQGLKVVVKVAGVPPGTHGLHIHEQDACGDQGKAAGGHFNPAGAPHGFLPKDRSTKAHAGDMGNIQVSRKGSGKATVVLPGVSLTGTGGTPSVDGRAIILHEKADDFGQPVGNAGGRIGCGVITISDK
ncbi:MAG: superoxide dismutase [Candidatus Omnitrophica bacterium CG11_big_fil_rev_8_21_14_0_20_63_9]|nr:MAG: superoxide dismutase [Candidatus Omnitrophica bacterium CG11_big_fil_rev_8_21_14_0_20_63_9]